MGLLYLYLYLVLFISLFIPYVFVEDKWRDVQKGTGSFPGLKRPGRGADHPPPPSAEVKKE
jgi:hypothetical protein